MSSATETSRSVGVEVAPPSVARPRPAPTGRSEGYWRAAADGRLLIQRCATCASWNHPPAISCLCCQGTDLDLEPVSGFGTVIQYVIVRQTKFASFEARVPYGGAAVELDEQEGLVVVGNVVGCAPEDVTIGARVGVEFEQIDEQLALPQFHLVAEAVGPS